MKVVQVLYSGLGGHGSVALSLAGTASAAVEPLAAVTGFTRLVRHEVGLG